MTAPLTPSEMRETVLKLLGDVAPEADLARLRHDVNIREQLDMDSMDFLNFIVALHKEFHVDLPESDYPQLVTVDGCVRYLKNIL